MAIIIGAVGKKHESWLRDGIDMYEVRLLKLYEVRWVLVPHCGIAQKAVTEESARLGAICRDDDYVILLDERGSNLTSVAWSSALARLLDESRRVVFLIGGAYGVDESVRRRANACWSLSSLVFPHQLVRLILIEQLYRSQSIALNQAYHHG